MITAAEIRMGNWLIAKDRDGDTRYVKVENFDTRAINWFTTSYTVEAEAYFIEDRSHGGSWVEGIPLTTEILEVAGFDGDLDWRVKGNDGVVFRLKVPKTNLTIDMNAMGGITLFDKGCVSTGTNIQYVHQLQNLYFALTGTELIIEL